MPTNAALEKLAKNKIPLTLAAMLAIHFSKQDKVLGIRLGKKVRELIAFYWRERNHLSNKMVEAAILRGTIKVQREKVQALIDKATSGQATLDDLQTAEIARVFSEKAASRLIELEQGLK